MRKFFGFSAILLLLSLSMLQVGITSCTKEITTHDTVVIIQKDTVIQIHIDTIRLVKNVVPVVNAGSDSTIRLSSGSDSLQLSGSATDPDSEIVSYLWSQVSGPNTALITNPGSAATYATNLISGTYVFQLMAIDGDGAVGVKRVSVTVELSQVLSLTLQPGEEGQDAIVAMRQWDNDINAIANHSYLPELSMSQWTYNGQGWGEGTNRSYLKFTGLSAIPESAEIVSAKLSLYGIPQQQMIPSSSTPQGNSYYTGTPYGLTNPAWIKRVTGGDWEESTITWNNKPTTTDLHQVAVPASTDQYGYNALNVDVTAMVKDMLSAHQNYGFCLQLQTEQVYRCLLFAGSEFPDATKRPKLVVQYRD